MKKLLILALAAIIAGAAFADTDPAFSGTFSHYLGVSLTEEDHTKKLKQDVTNSIKVDLNATVDEWNTVSVTVGLADALYWDDIDDDSAIRLGAHPVAGSEIDNRNYYLRLNAFTLTSDVLGAVGVTNSPVGIKMKLGKFVFGKEVSVASVAPLSSKGANGAGGTIDDFGIGLDVSIVDMVTLSSVFYPDPTGKKIAETGVTAKATGIAGMIDVAAYFVASGTDARIKENPDKDAVDSNGNGIGASVAVKPIDGLAFGLGWEHDMYATNSEGKDGIHKLQLDVGFTMVEKLGLGLSYSVEDLTAFEKKSKIRFSVTYDILEKLGVFGGIGVDSFEYKPVKDGGSGEFEAKKHLKFDAGLTTALGALAVQAGVSNSMDFKAPKDDWPVVLYVKFSASF